MTMATARADDIPIPSTLDVQEAKRVLESAAREAELNRRLDVISAYFLDRPYIDNSLVGGPDTPEVLTISLDAFDCVTYVETVLAFAGSTTVEAFIKGVRELRYRDRQIAWPTRNHYMIDWARNNEARGFIKDLTRGPDTVQKTRSLSAVAGLPVKDVTLRCFPKATLRRMLRICRTGDLVLFASTKKSLDVFHIGLLVQRNDELLMRHATRTAGKVIEQNLEGFVRGNRMSGLILLRPLDFGF
jgi:hypothetical protein